MLVFLYTRKGRECSRERERESATKESLTKSTPFHAIAKNSLFHTYCTVLLHDSYTLSMLFAFYGAQLQNKKFVVPYCTVCCYKTTFTLLRCLHFMVLLSWACNFILLLVHSIRETFVVLHR
jgi:hypothetical protein